MTTSQSPEPQRTCYLKRHLPCPSQYCIPPKLNFYSSPKAEPITFNNMALSTRYILVDKDAPAFWDPASASAFICILTVGILGAAAVTVRLYGKLKLTGNLAWDDMFMLLAGISSVSYTVMALLQVRYGLVVPMQERPYEVQLRYQTINYTARVFYLTGLMWFKASAMQLSICPEKPSKRMDIISTSLPSWYMWMDISRKGKRKFRDYQPIRSLRRLFLPLANPLQRWVRRSYYNFITKNEDKMGMSKILRQLQQIQDLPYYQMLFWNAEVSPIERAMGIRAKLWNITSKFRRWLRITEADLSYRFRTFIRLNQSPSQSDGIELDSTEENSKREKSKIKGHSDLDIPGNEQFNEGQDMEPLLKEQRESFLTNRNYNILFTSDKTLTDMIRDEELEYIEGIQWQAINEEQVDFKMRQNLAPTQNRNLDGLLFDEGSTSGWANGKAGKQRGIRRRK
ncbi:hypothetical protein TWF788_003012 [Orbilia oligospora]|uniref:Uncharacterized protein n=3 Tax=Orbilia oligospora TaxID=2813651 RepID=A0A7C8Q173_ORBOL|nr:hypothetical protein TWF788_003012 [Orbilia oligospora]